MSIDYFILGIISFYPATGYHIRTESEHDGMKTLWSGISYGSIYPRLEKLQQEGLIESFEEESEGRKKKVYELTPLGWKRLYDWLEVTPSDPVVRDELLLKILFFGTTRPEDRSLLIEHLLMRKSKTKKLLEYHLEWPKNGISSISEYTQFVINYTIAQLRAELEWIDDTIKQLQGNPHPPIQDPENLIGKQEQRRRAAWSKLQKDKTDEQ
jgi:PadR family transcriptional regulator AphA